MFIVYANNAFNSLNRNAFLHNIDIICRMLAQILINTYQAPVRLFVKEVVRLLPQKGQHKGTP